MPQDPYITLRCRTCNIEYSIDPYFNKSKYCCEACAKYAHIGGKGYASWREDMCLRAADVVKMYERLKQSVPEQALRDIDKYCHM